MEYKNKNMADDDRHFKEAIEALNKSDENKDVIDRVLSHLGEFGRYQKFLFICMMPVGVWFSFIYFVQMFIAATPQHHWCKVPELAHLDMELRRNLSAPGAAIGDDWDKCSTYNTNWTKVLETLTPPDPSTPKIPCQHGWEFDLVDVPYHTIVSEREWVCENAMNVPLAQCLYFVGSVIGGLMFGWMSDHFGRVPAFTISNMMALIGGVATIFTTGIWDFVFCRFLVGMACDTGLMLLYILMLEYVGPHHRTWTANLSIGIFFGGGAMALPWIALWVADWKLFSWVTSLPIALVLAAPFVLPESVRWLANKGKTKKAVAVLNRFERINNKKVPEEMMDEFIAMTRQKRNKSEDSLMSLMRSGPLRLASFILLFMYMACALVFDGLVRMSDNLGTDFFLTFSLTSGTEVVSLVLLVLVLDKWGRRSLSAIPSVATGVLMLSAIFVDKGLLLATLVIFARFFINMAYIVAVQWTTEILPTGVRGLGSSTLHVAGFLATTASPYIIYSAHVWENLPLLILGLLTLISGGVSVLLPETRGRPMPQTMADGERLVRQYSICGKPIKDVEVPEWKTEKEKALIT